MAEGRTGRRATIHDVAARAGVSAATVSKVLRGMGRVRPENAARIRAAVAELGYRLDPLAAGLRLDRRRIIGVVVPDLESGFFGALVTGLERAAEAAGYHTIIATSRESEAREADLVARMADWRVAGTVLVPVRSERGEGAQTMRRLGMVAVLADRVSADDRYDTVAADNSGASAEVADLLLGLGHRHILLHGSTRISKAVRTRVEGFAARARVLDPGVRLDMVLSDGEPEEWRRALAAYFDGHEGRTRPTAVFTLSQHSTLLVLAELRRRGIDCPGDIALVSFDDADWMQTAWPPVSAVAQPVEAIADRAMAALLARIEGDTQPPVAHLEPCRMHLRGSTGPARPAAPRWPAALRRGMSLVDNGSRRRDP